MAGLGRVQSARMATTPGAASSWRTEAGANARLALTLQVRHQSAVTSTKTVWPCATSVAIRLSSKGRQNPSTAVDGDGGAAKLGATRAAAIKPTTAARRSAIGRTRAIASTASTNSAPHAMAIAMLLSAASTQSNQSAVAPSATPRTRLSSSIQAPGRGSQSATDGTAATARERNAKRRSDQWRGARRRQQRRQHAGEEAAEMRPSLAQRGQRRGQRNFEQAPEVGGK